MCCIYEVVICLINHYLNIDVCIYEVVICLINYYLNIDVLCI